MYIITGLGRSGTSFAAQILKACGLFMGQYFNEEVNAGYEHPDVVRINKKILKGDFWSSASEDNEIVHVAQTVRVAKDPRFIITFGHWLRLGAPIEGVFLCQREIAEVLESSEISNAGTMSLFNGFPSEFRSNLALSILAGFKELCRSHGIPVFSIHYPQSVANFQEIESLSLIVTDKDQLRKAWETTRKPRQAVSQSDVNQKDAVVDQSRCDPVNTRSFQCTSLQSLSDYNLLCESEIMSIEAQRREFETGHRDRQEPFTLKGYCWLCEAETEFAVDFQSIKNKTGTPTINWRERMVCSKCGLNNRKRSTVHLFHHLASPTQDSRIYIAEQLSPIYRWLKQAYPNTVGSEYLGENESPGTSNPQGVRHEDLTRLTFEDGSLDYVLALDVLEHIPDYMAALKECRRVLKDSGMLFITVPFAKRSDVNIVRARMDDLGRIEHLLPPDYHGNPLDPQGSLAFYTFGWELLDQLRDLGFTDVKAHLYWSREYGYLGDNLFMFTAKVQEQAPATIPSGDALSPALVSSSNNRSLEIVDRPIFIVGCPRSGTTILARSLGQHSGLWVSTESDFIHHIMDHVEAAYKFGTARKKIWLSSENVSREEFFAHIGYGINTLFANRSSGRRWIDHSNSSTYCIDEIAVMFPDAQFLHIVRDGRDTINSMIHFKPTQPWAADFTTACRNWKLFVTNAQTFQRRHPDRMLQISYEALCSDSRTEFRKICHFLNLPFEQQVSDFMQKGRVNSSFSQKDRQRLSWQETWKDEESAIFFKHCGSLMTRLGYKAEENQHQLAQCDRSPIVNTRKSCDKRTTEIDCSIIIPVYNKLEYTQKCITSLLTHRTKYSCEIVIVDNASSDGTGAYLRRLSDCVKVITNSENVGYTLACNQGAKIATGKFICFLNNDTEVKPGWLDALVEAFDLYSNAGIVGSKLIYPDGCLQEAGGIIFKDGSGWNYGRFGNPDAPSYRYVREVDYVSGASLMIRHDLLKDLGYFDERYAPGYYEDTDLCFGVRDQGYLVLYCPFSQVIHHEGISSGTDLKQGMKHHQVVNHSKFIEKWSQALVNQQTASPDNVFKASARNTAGNVLIIDPFLPLFDRASGSLRLFTIVRLLKSQNYHVTYVARNGQDGAAYVELLEKMGVEVYATDPGMLRRMGYNVPGPEIDFQQLFSERRFDFAFISFYSLALQYLPLIRTLSSETRIIVDTVDIHFLREKRQAELSNDRKALQRSHETRLHELYIYSKADAVVTVTEDDWNQIADDLKGKPHFVIPNIHELPDASSDLTNRSGLLFVGNFNHPPNIDAVQYFVDKVLPLVRKSIPDITLTVVGNNPPREITDLNGKGVHVTGYVPITAPYLSQARVSVAPLRYGAGMKGKIGEAMSHGLPVVTTCIGAEGMGLSHGENAFVADDPRDFASHVVALCGDDALWRRVAANSKHYIEANFSPEIVGVTLERMIASIKKIPVLPAHEGRSLYFNEQKAEKKLVSIIILTWNQLSYTRKCVKSIQQHTKGKFELIFVDNGSTDGTVAWLQKLVKLRSNVTLIENATNQGFAKGCNQGIQAARGEYILLLNNDVEVTPNWLTGLLECLKSSPETGIVGPMTNNISGPQEVPEADYADMDVLDTYARAFRKKHRHRRIPYRRIVGFCMLFSRGLVEKVGLLDESFGSGNFEDDDFCLRAALWGYQNMIAGDVFIHHYGSRSFIGNKVDHGAFLTGNRKLFLVKWGKVDLKSKLGINFFILKTIEQALEHHHKGQTAKSADILLGAIKVVGKEPSLVFRLAELLIDSKQFKEALEILETLPQYHADAKALALAGYCKEGLEEFEAAEKLTEDALAVDDASARTLNLKGILAYRSGNIELAQSFFQKARQSDPGYGEPYANLGIILWDQGHRKGAFNLFEIGFMLAPGIAENANLYHLAAVELGELARAEQAFRDAGIFYPSHKKLTFLYIDLLLRQSKFQAAMDETEQALVLFGPEDGFLSAAMEIRKNLGPLDRISVEGAEDTISLCMIVKNEEKHLPKCLLNLKSLVDEMIIVDTGSEDQTRTVAEVFGAKVFDWAWTDDYAAARNFSIEKASGRWILIMDADEVIAKKDHHRLRGLLLKDRANQQAYMMTTRNYTYQNNIIGWNSNKGQYPVEESGMGWIPSDKVRLFPNDKAIRFEFPVHEVVGPSLLRKGIPTSPCPVPVHHYGKLDQNSERRKDEHYYKIGMAKLTASQNDPVAIRELAIQAAKLEKYRDAIDLWKRLIELESGDARAYVNLASNHGKLLQYHEARKAAQKAINLSPKMKEGHLNLGLSELHLGNAAGSETVFMRIVKHNTDYHSGVFLLGASQLCQGKIDKGSKTLRLLKSTPIWDTISYSIQELAESLMAAGQMLSARKLIQGAEKIGCSNDKIKGYGRLIDDKAKRNHGKQSRPVAESISA